MQTALTLALLVGAGLLVRTMINISNVQSGYSMSRILTMSVTAVEGDWAAFHHRALEKVAAVPGVQYAAFAWGVPLTGNNWPATVDIEGQPAPIEDSDRIAVPLRAVTDDYFKLIGMPLLDGRGFRMARDRKAAKVAMVNQALVDRYFPESQAIGKKLWLGGRRRILRSRSWAWYPTAVRTISRVPARQRCISRYGRPMRSRNTWSFEPPPIRAPSWPRSNANCAR